MTEKGQKSKKNIKKIVLDFLNKHKAAKLDTLTEHVAEHESVENLKEDGLKYTVHRTVKSMFRQGEIEMHETEHSVFASITPEGRQKLRSMSLGSLTSVLPSRWDGRWRIVIVDVPEENRELRDALRYFLKKARFVCYKNSVWISPFPMEHLVTQMKEDLKLSDELALITTDHIDSKTEESFQKTYLNLEN